MNIALYQKYLNEYVREAIQNSDRTNSGIYAHLDQQQVKGLFVRHKDERKRALHDAQVAFSEHRHWPLEIVLSHLGVDIKPEEISKA